MEKSLFRSKLFWVNLISTLIAAITGVAGADWVRDSPRLTSFLVAGIAFFNIVLRLVTNQPVTLGEPEGTARGNRQWSILWVAVPLTGLLLLPGCAAGSDAGAEFAAGGPLQNFPPLLLLIGGVALGFFLARKFPHVFPTLFAPGPSMESLVDQVADAVAKKVGK